MSKIKAAEDGFTDFLDGKIPKHADDDSVDSSSSDSLSPGGTILLITFLLGYLIFYWLRDKRSKNRHSSEDPIALKERRAQLAEARLRALTSLTPTQSSTFPSVEPKTEHRTPLEPEIFKEKEVESSSSTGGEENVVVTATQNNDDDNNKQQNSVEEEQSINNSSNQKTGITTTATRSRNDVAEQPQSRSDHSQKSLSSSPTNTATGINEISRSALPSTTTISTAGLMKDAKMTSSNRVDNVDSVISTFPETKKKPKKRRRPPPIQMICDALSSTLDVDLTVENHPDTNSWGGVGWWKTSSQTSSAAAKPNKSICLKMNTYYDPTKENDWKFLCGVLSQCLAEEESSSSLQNGEKELLKFHCLFSEDETLLSSISSFNKLQKLSAQGHTPFLVPNLLSAEQDFQSFSNLCKELQNDLVKIVSNKLHQDEDTNKDQGKNIQHTIADDDDDGGLFSDEYDPSFIPQQQTEPTMSSSNNTSKSRNTTPWNDFMDLVCKESNNNNGVISLNLLKCLAKESEHGDLPRRILSRIFQELEKRLSVDVDSNSPSQQQTEGAFQQINQWLQPLSKFYTFFTPLVIQNMKEELLLFQNSDSVPSKNGRQIENSALLLTPLVRTAAIALHAGDDGLYSNPNQQSIPLILHEFQQIPNYPMSIYQHPPSRQVSLCITSLRQTSRMAQSVVVSWMKATMKEDKECVFEWIRYIVTKNKLLATLAKNELLDTDPNSTTSQCFTRSFLLGFVASFLDLCCRSLMDRYDLMGATNAFDATYLLDDANWRSIFQDESHRALSTMEADRHSSTKDTRKYSGSTNFFFLTTALLRVALNPALKMEREFHRANSRAFDIVRAEANRSSAQNLPEPFLVDARKKICIWMGWKVQLEEPEFVTNVTNFTLLQLQWVLAQCKGESVGGTADNAHNIPDWIVKDPSRWLAEVAHHTPHLLRQNHAEKAIECATELLEVGHEKSFSPIVMTCLLRIATAFVYAGVNRARQRQRKRSNKRWGGTTSDSVQEFDSRDPSIYLSFDKNDLGVTVFTNRLVCTRLCPTLIRTFVTLDVVEGLDMDVEYDFDKFSVKNEVADLLLRLWSHPNGECRQSVVTGVTRPELQSFASSLAATLSVFFDDAVQKMSTTIKTIRAAETNPGGMMTASDRHFVESHSSSASSGFMGSRRLFMLLCTLSAESSIAASFGGVAADKSLGPQEDASSVRDLANLIVHFIDIITDSNGGTHPELELELSESTHSMIQRDASIAPAERKHLINQIVKSRQYSRDEFGLDVSVVCHQLLALAASWHVGSKNEKGSAAESPLLDALANHEDLDLNRWRQIYNRLLVQNVVTQSSHIEIFTRDGYRVSSSSESPKTASLPSEDPRSKRRRQTAKHDQMTHEEIEALLGSERNINILISDLSKCLESRNKPGGASQNGDIGEMQQKIMTAGAPMEDEEYGQDLSDYVVSSSPFSSAVGTFLHHYDRTARFRLSIGSGDKSLIKEAKKCHKTLPAPHANSSCFVCFAEERMDLCRGIITGPVDTPYAHGLFVFDVYFPPTYPSVPPLVTFMTTGGGQVRFNPNLYVDGKVCLSLLGLTYAQGESQRWNPQQSSLAQVLLSMQAQIFGVKEPYFNEGSGIPLQLRNTPAGQEGSRKHNAMLRLATLRHAVVSQLRNPPLGFEEVTKRHFSMCRKRLLVQARRWMIEEGGNPKYAPRFEKAYIDLLRLLMPLGDYDAGKCLLPLREDAIIVEASDLSFQGITVATKSDDSSSARIDSKLAATESPHSEEKEEEATKPPAKPVGFVQQRPTVSLAAAQPNVLSEDVPYNPWAAPSPDNHTSTSPQEEGGGKGKTADDDDDDDMYA